MISNLIMINIALIFIESQLQIKWVDNIWAEI
jgi:hypothetical protein